MHVISRRYPRDLTAGHPDAEGPLDAWYRIAKAASWQNLLDVRRTWPSAASVGELTVFNVKGNTYRLIARVFYREQTLLVRHVLTHADYAREEWKR